MDNKRRIKYAGSSNWIVIDTGTTWHFFTLLEAVAFYLTGRFLENIILRMRRRLHLTTKSE